MQGFAFLVHMCTHIKYAPRASIAIQDLLLSFFTSLNMPILPFSVYFHTCIQMETILIQWNVKAIALLK